MTLLICVPLILVVAGLLARRWFVNSRQDIRSIESHRSSLHRLEHLAPEDSGSPGASAGSAHVRIVGHPADRPGPAVRPMVWGRVDGRPPAARPSWHFTRPEPVRARYAQARSEVLQHLPEDREDQPRIVITDASVVGDRPVASEPARNSAPRATPAGRPAARSAAPPPVSTSDPAPGPVADRRSALADDRPPVVIADDDAGDPPPAVVPDSDGPDLALRAVRPAGARSGRAAHSGRRRAVRVLASAAGLMVVAAGAGVAVEELHPGGGAQAAHRASGPGPARSPDRVSTTVPPAPPPTAPPTLSATSTSATDALYTLPPGPLTVSLSASAACWVELRSGSPSGPISYEGTLQPGASQTFATSGGMWLRLGDPAAVHLQINGAYVDLPGRPSPFNVTVTTA